VNSCPQSGDGGLQLFLPGVELVPSDHLTVTELALDTGPQFIWSSIMPFEFDLSHNGGDIQCSAVQCSGLQWRHHPADICPL
jgi:hypothetical protein